MKKMIAKLAFNYRQVDLKPGEEFDCDDRDVDLLKLIGRAHEKGADPSAQDYGTRHMTARNVRGKSARN
jgi:hypothetical protein